MRRLGRRPALKSEDGMQARNWSRIDMGRSAHQYSVAHPEASPGYSTAVKRLGELLTRCDALADQQKAGHAQVAAAAAQKRDLLKTMKQGYLRHLAKIARVAAVEKPELAVSFAPPDRSAGYLESLSIARTITATALENRELMVKYGMADSMLDGLTTAIATFEQALEQGKLARQTHVAATAELDEAVAGIMTLVRALDGLNRVRFAGDPEQLAAWRSATNVVTPVRSRTRTSSPAPIGAEVQPAA